MRCSTLIGAAGGESIRYVTAGAEHLSHINRLFLGTRRGVLGVCRIRHRELVVALSTLVHVNALK